MTRLLCFWIIGNSSPIDADRRVGWDIKTLGWRGFRQKRLDSVRAVNPTLPVWLHNPGGTLANENMQLTQFLQAQQAGLAWLTDGFADAFKPFAQAGELVIYLGGEQDDVILNRYKSRANRVKVVKDAIKPVLDCGASLAVDASALLPRDSVTFAEMDRLRQSGKPVYIEALRPWPSEHLKPFRACMTEQYANHRDRPTWNVAESDVETVMLKVDRALTEQDIADASARGYSLAGGVTVELARAVA